VDLVTKLAVMASRVDQVAMDANVRRKGIRRYTGFGKLSKANGWDKVERAAGWELTRYRSPKGD